MHCKGVAELSTPTNGGVQLVKYIPEGDVYRLIIKSKLPSAEKFEKWVFDEVLPTLRKTGGYINNTQLVLNTYFSSCNEEVKILVGGLLNEIENKQKLLIKSEKENGELKLEIEHKEDVIIGLVGDIDLAEKRQRITQIIRKGTTNYSDRYSLLYQEFEKKYHMDLNKRMKSKTYEELTPKLKNKMDLIDRGFNMIPELYEICCKLFENEFNTLIKEWEFVIKK